MDYKNINGNYDNRNRRKSKKKKKEFITELYVSCSVYS